MKRLSDRIASFLTKSPTRFFFVAAIAAFFVLWFVNEYKDPSGFKWHDVIVESHGVLFDLLVFGILLSIYEALRDKRDKVERLQEEIADYRRWDEKEAMYRIVGAIKRLNREKVSAVDLSFCFLQRADLLGVNLEGAKLMVADLQWANLQLANLQRTNFIAANLKWANLLAVHCQWSDLESANFERASLERGNFEGSNLESANLLHANLTAANLKDVNLKGANLEGANLDQVLISPDWFQKLETWQVIGREAIIEKYYMDENNRLQFKENQVK